MSEPVPMVLFCPECSCRHIDEGDFATKPHHTHACQHCGFVWRPAVAPTVGVEFLPGFKSDDTLKRARQEVFLAAVEFVDNEGRPPGNDWKHLDALRKKVGAFNAAMQSALAAPKKKGETT